jgi:hypothetical protein
MTDKDKIAALEARIEELERKAKPPEPEKPFVEEPYQRYDPTAGMTMPRSALEEMLRAEPRGFMAGVVRDARAPNTPGTLPRTEGPTSERGGNVPGSGTGWAHEVKLGPPPGIQHVDAQLIADEVRQRAELKRKLGG